VIETPQRGNGALCDLGTLLGYVVGGSTIELASMYSERKRNLAWQSLCYRGNFVATVGRDQAVIRNSIHIWTSRKRKARIVLAWRYVAAISTAPKVGAGLATSTNRFERFTF